MSLPALRSGCRINEQPTVLTDFGSLEEGSLAEPVPRALQPHQQLPGGTIPTALTVPSSCAAEPSLAKVEPSSGKAQPSPAKAEPGPG